MLVLYFSLCEPWLDTSFSCTIATPADALLPQESHPNRTHTRAPIRFFSVSYTKKQKQKNKSAPSFYKYIYFSLFYRLQESVWCIKIKTKTQLRSACCMAVLVNSHRDTAITCAVDAEVRRITCLWHKLTSFHQRQFFFFSQCSAHLNTYN